MLALAIPAAWATATLVGWLLQRAGFPLPDSQSRMGCVDGLRGYLALSVLAHHYGLWTGAVLDGKDWGDTPIPVLRQLGAGAVGLFFMITGFVFYRRIIDGFRETSWPVVYITRVFRIMPLVIVSIAAVAVMTMTRTGHVIGRDDLVPLIRWMTFSGEPGLAGDADAGRTNAYVLWSLRLEWEFYLLVLPACAALMDVIRARIPSVVIPILLSAATVLGAFTSFKQPLLFYLVLFAAGMLAYEARQHPTLVAWFQTRAAAIVAVAALGLAASVYASPSDLPALPAFALFFVCVACGNSFFSILRTRGALVIGEVSFSIYLLHGLIVSLLFRECHQLIESVPADVVPVFLPVVTVVVVLVSCVTYLCVERPAIRLGSRLASRWTDLRVRSRSPEVEIAP